MAQWTLDDGSGTSVADSIGTATGTASAGTSWITSGAAVGTGAMQFDGSSGRVLVTSAGSTQVFTPTVTFWMRADTQPAPGAVLFEKGAFACTGPSYGLNVEASTLRFHYRAPGTTSDFWYEVSFYALKTDLWDGGWHLLSLGISMSGRLVSISIQIDGNPAITFGSYNVPVGQQSAFRYSSTTSSSFAFGGPVDPTCGEPFFSGALDDFRVYDAPIDAVNIMPTTPTVTTVDTPTGTLRAENPVPVHIHVEPPTPWGAVHYHLERVDAVDSETPAQASLDVNGDFNGSVIPPVSGTWKIVASYDGSGAWQPSGSESASFAVSKVPTKVTLAFIPAVPQARQQLQITATVKGTVQYQSYPVGNVTFYDSTSGSDVVIGTAFANAVVMKSGVAAATLTLPSGYDAGTMKFKADFAPTGSTNPFAKSTSAVYTEAVSKGTTVAVVAGPTTVEAHSGFDLTGSFSPDISAYEAGTTMTFKRVGTSTPICTVATTPTKTICSVPGIKTVGSYQYTVKYSGNGNALAATSAPITVTVIPDVVHASGVGVTANKIYPVVDSYFDTVGIKGSRAEPISVAIKIYNATNALVRSTTIALGTGAYSYLWNGKTGTGTVLPEGTYRIDQTLKDAAGTTLLVSSNVTLSQKFLTWHNSTVVEDGRDYAAYGVLGSGTVSIPDATHQVKLTASNISTDVAGAGWEFLLPSAIAYRSLTFRVYATHKLVTGGFDIIGAQNFVTCPRNDYWNDTCFDSWHDVGNSTGTTGWFTTGTLTDDHRTTIYARGFIETSGGVTYVNTAEFTLQYATLGY